MTDRRLGDLFAAGVGLAGERATAETVGALRAHGVEPIVLKGPALTRWLHPQGSERYSTDIDLLVAPDEVDAARAGLREIDYAPLFAERGGEPHHAEVWVRPGAFAIDVHHRLVGVEAPAAVAWRELSAAIERTRVGMLEYSILEPNARALHVVLHAAQHGLSDERVLGDLDRVVDMLAPEAWDGVAGLAVRLQAVDAFGVGLRLSEAGRAVADRLELPPVEKTATALRSAGAPHTSLGIERLARARGPRAKTALILRELVPHPSYMRVWHPLADRGTLGLAAAYAIRPFWLLRWSVRGFRAWLAARRETRRG